MKKLICTFIAILFLAGLSCTAHAESSGIGVEPGQAMPDFTVETTDGGTVTLSEVRKDKELVVLNIFATWCTPCELEFPEMEKTYQAHKDQMEIISVSADPDDTLKMVADYKQSHDLTFPMGVAGDGLSFLKISAFPTTIFIDRNGNVGFIKVGSFTQEGAFEEKVGTFLSADYDGTPLTSEIAKGGMTAYLLLISLGVALLALLLFVIGRWRIFSKAGKPGWYSIIPFLGTYEEYSLCWNSAMGIFAVLCSIGLIILSYVMPRMQTNWTIIGTGVLGFILFLVSLVESIKLSKAFGKGTGFGVFLIFFKSIGRFILGIGKAEYQGK